MNKRTIFTTFIVLCLSFSLFAQTQPKLHPFKLGRLEPGDNLRISVSREPRLANDFRRFRLTVNVVVGSDGKLVPASSMMREMMPELVGVMARGLTLGEIKQLLESRYADKNLDTSVNVQFTGSGGRQPVFPRVRR
jgi:protein involved in polysaccharide export with SLBB domain